MEWAVNRPWLKSLREKTEYSEVNAALPHQGVSGLMHD